MNFFEKTLYMLQFEMNKPEPYGWFHLMWIAFTIILIVTLFKLRKKYSNKQLQINFNNDILKKEIKRCEFLGIKKLVLHPGSHVGNGVELGLNTIIKALNMCLDENTNIVICLETMAGKGSELGTNFEQMKYIIDNVRYNDKLGICMDTCHMNDQGYDISDFDKILDEFDRVIGLNKLACIHINDSKNEKGTKKDRHENFGFGHIGFEPLINVIYNKRIENIPKILETPYVKVNDKIEKPPYKYEINMLLNNKFNDKLIDNGYEELILSKTGLVINSYFSASKIVWILDNVNGARELAQKDQIKFGTIDSYLLWKLT